jgi:hypothetical protein
LIRTRGAGTYRLYAENSHDRRTSDTGKTLNQFRFVYRLHQQLSGKQLSKMLTLVDCGNGRSAEIYNGFHAIATRQDVLHNEVAQIDIRLRARLNIRRKICTVVATS